GQAAALVGPIDVLVNNASTLGPVPLRLLLDTDCEDLERALAVNLVGPFRLTKAIAGPMLLRGSGTLLKLYSRGATGACSAEAAPSSTSPPTPRRRPTSAGAPTARRRPRSSRWGASGRRSSPAP